MNQLPVLKLNPSKHNDVAIIQLLFERNIELQNYLRTKTCMRWSKTMNCWYLPFSKTITSDLFQLLKNKVWLDYINLKDHSVEPKPVMKKQIERTSILRHKDLSVLSEEAGEKIGAFKNWLRSKRYSESTIETYVDSVTTFLRYYAHKSITEITNNDTILFNNNYILANKLSASFQNQIVNAIKLFFRTIENKKIDPDLIHRPKRSKVLPNVLSKEEVKSILQALSNVKHKTMLSLIYSCGLRCGELLKLKASDIDSKRGLILVKQAKGRKDRIVPLSNKILELLRQYWQLHEPKNYIFEGKKIGEMYDERSLQQVLKQAIYKAGIKKPVTLHWLRHSYATHLLENGTDLRYIQEILGHRSSKTTEIYTHVSNKAIQQIVSPFDYL